MKTTQKETKTMKQKNTNKKTETEKGKNEKVRDWLLRECPERKPYILGFSKTVTFQDIADRMEGGEYFEKICKMCDDGELGELCYKRMEELFTKPLDYWKELNLVNVNQDLILWGIKDGMTESAAKSFVKQAAKRCLVRLRKYVDFFWNVV